MARPKWIGTLFFNNVSFQYGFSESYYPIGPDESTATTAMQTLLGNRLDMITDNWKISFARLDVTDTARDSVLIPLPSTRTGNYAIVSGAVELPADSCFLITLFGDSTKKNRKFLRPVVSNDMSGPNTPNPSTAWNTAFAALSATLMASFFVARNTSAVNYFVPCTQVIFEDFRNRKTGRPFGQPRGRRP